jgi:hypothetical protein
MGLQNQQSLLCAMLHALCDLLLGGPTFLWMTPVNSVRAVAQTHRLPFDRLRVNGGVLKSFDFSAHAKLVEA